MALGKVKISEVVKFRFFFYMNRREMSPMALIYDEQKQLNKRKHLLPTDNKTGY